MARSITDDGAVVAASKPIKHRRYEVGRLPDPGACVDATIVINDRADGVPRARLALSNGASWDALALAGDIRQPADIEPLVRQLIRELVPVREALPALQLQPDRGVNTHPEGDISTLSGDVRVMAGHMAQMVEAINDQAARLTVAENRVAELERRLSALDGVRVPVPEDWRQSLETKP
jgi:hypothetical protein